MKMRTLGSAILTLSLVACGGGGSGGSGGIGGDNRGASDLPEVIQDNGGPITSASTIIKNFSVKGYESADDAVVKISAYENGGVFQLSWEATTPTDPYRVDFHTSFDPVLSNDDDDFAGYNCGYGGLYTCGSQGSKSCTFDSENRVICGERSAFNLGDDLTSLLDALPKDLYILIEVCDGLFNDCKVEAVKVRFE